MEQEHVKKSGMYYSKAEVMRFIQNKNQLKERMSINESRENGRPQEDFKDWESNEMWSEKVFEATNK